jgi:glycosyltransferase involved in cell wall biosynthesis
VKVVMLVDNGVEGDSRVQKTARSAADAGWDVTLLGLSTTGEPRDWRLGQAHVRLLPMPYGKGKGLRGSLLARGGWPLRLARRARRPVEHVQVWFWTAVHRDRAWRKLEPGLWNYERVYGPVIDELAPDLIHANDFRMLGVGARAKARAAAQGRSIKLVWDAHEYLPGVKPGRDNARWLPAHRAHEREYAPQADAVVTVSESHAELLRKEHNLAQLPEVVLNAPEITQTEPAPDLRELCGVGKETPLIVYSGAASSQRGLDTVIAALPYLDGVHVALVVDRELPIDHPRVHAVPYVAYRQVVPFLSAADAGVIPIHHWPNHELALITKFLEYSHARLPIIVSDVKAMADMTRKTGQGEVFRAKDVADFVRATRKVLDDPQRYRAAYDDDLLKSWTWEAQAAKLDALYHRITA